MSEEEILQAIQDTPEQPEEVIITCEGGITLRPMTGKVG